MWHFFNENDEKSASTGVKEANSNNNSSNSSSELVRLSCVIRHHEAAVTCLEYDGIECIVSANAAGLVVFFFLYSFKCAFLNVIVHFCLIICQNKNDSYYQARRRTVAQTSGASL